VCLYIQYLVLNIMIQSHQCVHPFTNATIRRLIVCFIVVLALLSSMSWIHCGSNHARQLDDNNEPFMSSSSLPQALESSQSSTASTSTSTTSFPDRNLVFDMMQLSADIFDMEKESSPADAITNPKYKLELFIKANFSTHAMVVTERHDEDEGYNKDDNQVDYDHDQDFFKNTFHSISNTTSTLKNNTKKTCIVVYRGSDEIADWLVDLNIKLEKSKFVNAPQDVMVHRGFQDALFGQNITDIVENKVLELIGEDGDGEVIVTGHSLGGANSHITGAFLADKHPKMKLTVINFGCPRLGNNGFKAWTEQQLSNLSTWRFVYRADTVPRIVPRTLGYKHAGHLFMIYKSDSKIYYHQTGLKGIYQGAPWSWYCAYIIFIVLSCFF